MNDNPIAVSTGSLLVAEPFLGDGNFDRSVVLICEHSPAGSFGLIMNQATELQLSDVLDDVYADLPLFVGGPVQQNTLHFIHRRPDLIDGAIQVDQGLYWSGDFDQVKQAVNLGTLTEHDIRFFLGYSGWDGGQLATEIEHKSWIITRANANFLFNTPVIDFWRDVLKQMGGMYQTIAHYPADPSLN
jgi:putative transcriptional regulator